MLGSTVRPAAAEARAPHTLRTGEQWCETELDRLVRDIRRNRTTGAEKALTDLALQCTELPQIQHAQASLAARQGRWDDAIALLETSIALDTRAAHSVEALRSIHRWRAAEAYAQALGERRRVRSGPVPQLQGSTMVNSDTRRQLARDAALREHSVLDYELWNWWSSAVDGYPDEHREHYSDTFRGTMLAAAQPPASLPDWEAVARDIDFTGNEAVALVRWQSEGARSGRMLLLHLVDDRWQIYLERAL